MSLKRDRDHYSDNKEHCHESMPHLALYLFPPLAQKRNGGLKVLVPESPLMAPGIAIQLDSSACSTSNRGKSNRICDEVRFIFIPHGQVEVELFTQLARNTIQVLYG